MIPLEIFQIHLFATCPTRFIRKQWTRYKEVWFKTCFSESEIIKLKSVEIESKSVEVDAYNQTRAFASIKLDGKYTLPTFFFFFCTFYLFFFLNKTNRPVISAKRIYQILLFFMQISYWTIGYICRVIQLYTRLVSMVVKPEFL